MLKKSHLMVHCYQILCFSMSNYLNVYTFFIILTVTLLNVFFPLRFSVYTFYWLSDEGITY